MPAHRAATGVATAQTWLARRTVESYAIGVRLSFKAGGSGQESEHGQLRVQVTKHGYGGGGTERAAAPPRRPGTAREMVPRRCRTRLLAQTCGVQTYGTIAVIGQPVVRIAQRAATQ